MAWKRGLCIAVFFGCSVAAADESTSEGDKLLSGMSIVGNDDAPKSLVIVPWKSSSLGHSLGVSQGVGDGREAVDRDVFRRELEYYEISVGKAAVSDSN